MSFGRYTDDVEKRDRMLDVYRERYSEKGWCENKIYPGMAELLRDLQKKREARRACKRKARVFLQKKIIKIFRRGAIFRFYRRQRYGRKARRQNRAFNVRP
ncbi:MAG: hypothetical protein L6V85_09160 [Clostridiales bacterium]|nr:MAG: hypothetical protein L6V85_09160 [Clostridiales bacterium]